MTVDLDRATLTDAVAALGRREVSSEELLDAQLDRVDTFNPSVNAVVTLDVDRARDAARAADDARSAGNDLGPLAGVPLTIKDTYETAGLLTTAGAPAYREHVPTADADVVVGVREAGGVIYAKTNTPLMAGDHQTYNEVFGLTRNPWDPDRSAAGSSGGSAVSVACGFSLGEVGSDIGSSIRLPAHFNGVFGLKPTWGVISERGHIPGPPGTLAPTDLGVMGPLGRSIADLELLLDACLRVNPMLGVPGARLPDAEPVDVGALRVGVWSDDPLAPVDRTTSSSVIRFADRLADLGAVVEDDRRPAVDPERLHDTYERLLFSAVGAGFPPPVRAMLAEVAADEDAPFATTSFEARNARDSIAGHAFWLRADEQRAKAQAAWARLFDEVDLMVLPVAPTQAFPHDTERPYVERTVRVDEVERPYHHLLFWAGLATMPGLPSVVIPVGPTGGLPMGVQLVGPRWSDRRLLATAGVIVDALGLGFEPPPLVSG